MFYVSMVDTFLSDWGMSEGKKNVLVFECETAEEAETVAENAENRSDMKKVEIHYSYPSFPSKSYYVQDKDKEDYPSWYIAGYFK